MLFMVGTVGERKTQDQIMRRLLKVLYIGRLLGIVLADQTITSGYL